MKRPFVFGPCSIEDLDLLEEESPLRDDLVREGIIEKLEETNGWLKGLCMHGYSVQIKDRTLKRRTTILKHARFLRNLKVSPNYPPEPEPEVVEGEEGEKGDEDDDDDN